jgi:hypothetical protein
MSDVYVLGTRMLNRILGNINGTCVDTVDSHGVLSETIVTKKIDRVQQLPAAMYSTSAVEREIEDCFLLI